MGSTSRSIIPDCIYRVKITGYAKDGTQSKTLTETSFSIVA